MATKAITKERFDALCRVKLPSLDYLVNEVEWFSDDDERVLGIVLLDNTDQDWSWMVLGRDEAGLFRAIDLGVSIATREEAKKLLMVKLLEHSATGESVFPQGDVERDSMDLFKSATSAASLHENYRILASGIHHSSARKMLSEIARAFVDVDGNFLKDFQTTGFNARLWELYLHAFLYEQRFDITREFDRPDFCTVKGDFPVGIEAVTVNPTAGEKFPNPENETELKALRENFMPIKFGSALFSKLKKRYWDLPHMRGMPFVLAIHDFCGNDSMTWSAPAIEDYLFGLRASWRKDENGKLHITENKITEHRWGNKTIPSGFFNQPGAEHISAVLFSNSATLSKFNRMGKLAGFGSPEVKMIRVGVKHNFDPNATEPIPFRVEVEPGKYSERWTEGVRVFHNSLALLPIPPGVFEQCAHHFLKEGRRVAMLPDGFIHSSRTMVLAPKSSSVT
ncbi:MAG: hypothetical protein ABIP85_07765 [Chthoniobacteraceae bacterium]